MRPNLQQIVDLVTFADENLNGNLYFSVQSTPWLFSGNLEYSGSSVVSHCVTISIKPKQNIRNNYFVDYP